MQLYLVELYIPGITESKIEDVVRRAEEAGIGEVRHRRSTIVPEDETGFCLFEAASLEVLREAGTRASLPVERITEAYDLPAPERRRRTLRIIRESTEGTPP